MKLCKDCRWARVDLFEWIFGVYRFAKCHHPEIVKPSRIDPVTGEETGGGFWFCDSNRAFKEDQCGPDGKLWEPRK